MTQKNNGDRNFEQALRAVRDDVPDQTQLDAAAGRVWSAMQSSELRVRAVEQIRGCEDVQSLLADYEAGTVGEKKAALIDAHLHECVACRRKAKHQREQNVNWARPVPVRAKWRLMPSFAMSAAAVIVFAIVGLIIHNTYFAIPAGARAKVQSLDGVAYRVTADGERLLAVGEEIGEGERVRTTAGSHALLQLSDGSIVEVNQHSEFAVNARGKDTTVAMDGGAIIVQAAKRKLGHLYVKTPDCRVAVTGTIFSVNSGVKGSRVSVIEGAVRVKHSSADDLLHAGDQVSTSDNMAPVPVDAEIAWSRNAEQHLATLAKFVALKHAMEQVHLPAPRHTSALLNRVPEDVVLYASIPNIGQTLADAARIFQNQVDRSPELRVWAERGGEKDRVEFNQAIERIRAVSEYLGDEIVVVGLNEERTHGGALLAEVRRTGLAQFLRSQAAQSHAKMLVVEPANMVSLTPANTQGQTLALVRGDIVVFSPDLLTLDKVNAQLTNGRGEFGNSEFGQRVAEAYTRGAGFLLAADLGRIVNSTNARQPRNRRQARGRSTFAATGLNDARYFIAEHREVNNTPENRVLVDFAAARRGIASWLASPAPMGSLEFVSRNAAVAVAVIAKDPAQIFDDIVVIASADNPKSPGELASAESKLQLRFREDMAAHFGSDMVIALDGPVLPTPAWKAVIEVHDPQGLQASFERLAQVSNEDARRHGHPEVQLTHEDLAGQRYYEVGGVGRAGAQMHYTFANGYMIVAQSRAVLMNTLLTRANGDSLARSGEFRALLPRDPNANYSMIAYQNLGPVLQPLLSQLSGERAALVQQLAADAKPSVICAWGEQSRIEATSNSRLFGFDWLALGNVLHSGTTRTAKP